MGRLKMRQWDRSTYALIGAGILLFFALSWTVSRTIPVGVDFRVVFYPAARALLEGRSPYSVHGFYNPPWLLLLLVPLALLPKELAWGVFITAGLSCYLAAFYLAKMSRFELILAVFSPLVLYGLWYGNIDFLVLLGAMLPPTWGIWLVALKPQMGLVLLAYWGIRGYWKRVLLAAAGVGLAVLWQTPAVGDMFWNTSAWPWGIPVGLALTAFAFAREDEKLAIAAGPFLSPYVSPPSWVTVLPALKERRWLLITFFILSWIGVWVRNALFNLVVGVTG